MGARGQVADIGLLQLKGQSPTNCCTNVQDSVPPVGMRVLGLEHRKWQYKLALSHLRSFVCHSSCNLTVHFLCKYFYFWSPCFRPLPLPLSLSFPFVSLKLFLHMHEPTKCSSICSHFLADSCTAGAERLAAHSFRFTSAHQRCSRPNASPKRHQNRCSRLSHSPVTHFSRPLITKV